MRTNRSKTAIMITTILVVILMLGNAVYAGIEVEAPEYKMVGLPEGSAWIAEIVVDEEALGDITVNAFDEKHEGYLSSRGEKYLKADQALDEYCSSHGLCRTYNTRFSDDTVNEDGAWVFLVQSYIGMTPADGRVVERIAVYVPDTGDLAVSEPVTDAWDRIQNRCLCIDCSDISNGNLKFTGVNVELLAYWCENSIVIAFALVFDLIAVIVLSLVKKKGVWSIVVIDLIINLLLAVIAYFIVPHNILVPYKQISHQAVFIRLLRTRPVAVLIESAAYILFGKRSKGALFDKKETAIMYAVLANLVSLLGAMIVFNSTNPFDSIPMW